MAVPRSWHRSTFLDVRRQDVKWPDGTTWSVMLLRPGEPPITANARDRRNTYLWNMLWVAHVFKVIAWRLARKGWRAAVVDLPIAEIPEPTYPVTSSLTVKTKLRAAELCDCATSLIRSGDSEQLKNMFRRPD